MQSDEKKKLLKLTVTLLMAQGKPIPPEYREIAEEIKREREKWVGETIQRSPQSVRQ